MDDQPQTQLQAELARLRQRVAELESAVAWPQRDKGWPALLEHSFEAIALLDVAGIILDAGPAVSHLAGYTPAERLGQNGLALVYPPESAAMGLRFTLSHPVTAAIPPGDETLFAMALKLGPGSSRSRPPRSRPSRRRAWPPARSSAIPARTPEAGVDPQPLRSSSASAKA